ncbi:Phage head-tail joining protein [Pseudovibrio axinellae]|uniref:Phage head-tail joining protein n=1 Tax=Pseudovibrio axinellae TaxID=989403 RepID=A0A165SVW8_9HYPH|nr:head-tail adaptor protein [Pseudovibrio axinellae]KZL04545.1 Phage head-tail joining protein [Pseudovibrio axinellae]SEQ73623.1 Phage head-tail joining protein [Pseudovibrio axinellae]
MNDVTMLEVVAFEALVSSPDGYGNKTAGYETQFEVRAHFRYLRGGESVIGARLEGIQPVVVTIWRSPDTEAIQTSWRMKDLITGTVYAVRTKVPSDDHLCFELTCESGEIDG